MLKFVRYRLSYWFYENKWLKLKCLGNPWSHFINKLLNYWKILIVFRFLINVLIVNQIF